MFKLNKKVKNKKTETMGSKIRKLRLENHLTQEALAEKLFVSDGTISKWEKDISAPNYNYLKAMGKIFKVKASYFLEDTSPKGRFKLFIKISFEFTKSNWYKIIIVGLFLFLATYFVNTFDSLEMYEIMSSDKNITIESGYYIKSRKKIIMTLNNITYQTDEDDIVSQKLKLYVLDKDDKIYFYESDNLDNVEYKNFIGYDLTDKMVKHLDKNLYLEIENVHSDNSITKYESKLALKLSITNGSILYFDDITIDFAKEKTTQIDEHILFQNGYKKINDSKVYYKKFKNYELYFDLDSKKMTYEESQKPNISIKIEYLYDVNSLVYRKKKDKELVDYYIYTNESSKISCIIGKCDNYLETYNYIKDIYDKAFS